MMIKLMRLKFSAIVVLALFVLSSFACQKNNPPGKSQHQAITLNITADTLSIGEEVTLIPQFTPDETNAEGYEWKVADGDVAGVTVNSDHSATVIAKSKGETSVSISSPQGEVLASCTIKVDEVPDDGIVKILAIGNSFSQDALEYYLYGLANAAGKRVVIGNLYMGGASLKQHVQNFTNNTAAYDFRKIDEDGEKTNTPKSTIETAVASENWDYISFQQASSYSGQYKTFVEPLPALYNYVKERATSPQVKYILHQTWAYAKNSTHGGFANYDKDQQTMYKAIVKTYNQAKDLIPAELIVPAGTAIQNGRTSVIGDNFNRDGYHLDLNIGRYTASCTWFEAIFGESVIGNTFKPAALTDYETEIAQHGAHLAVLNPDAVTPMTDYQGGGTGIITDAVFVDFGHNVSSPEWNGLTGHLNGTSIPNLKDDKGDYTGVSLSIIERFNNINNNGAKSTATDFDIPEGVSSDSYYGNPKKLFGGNTIQQSVVKFEKLDKTKKYNFCFFASRMNVAAGENRETKYTVKGKNEGIALLDASNNSSNTACVDGIQPDASGAVTITITAGEHNTNEYGFYYLNALRLTPATH